MGFRHGHRLYEGNQRQLKASRREHAGPEESQAILRGLIVVRRRWLRPSTILGPRSPRFRSLVANLSALQDPDDREDRALTIGQRREAADVRNIRRRHVGLATQLLRFHSRSIAVS